MEIASPRRELELQMQNIPVTKQPLGGDGAMGKEASAMHKAQREPRACQSLQHLTSGETRETEQPNTTTYKTS